MSEKKKVGRPTKLTPKLIEALKVVSENAIYLTDEDLVFLVNDVLEPKDKIAYKTFRDFKNGEAQQDNELMLEFSTLIKKALLKEKLALLRLVKKGDNGWQSKSWILERKFKEWNLTNIQKTDITTKGESITPVIKWTE